MRRALLLWFCACAHERHVVAPPDEVDDPAARLSVRPAELDGYQAAYRLTWNGERIGDARERFVREGSGWRFERNERVQVLRGGALASARTRVTVMVDDLYAPQSVEVERESGGSRILGRAFRLGDRSWNVVYNDGPARVVDGSVVPATLVPILMAARGGRGFDGTIMVEGAGLATAHLHIEVSNHLASARLVTAAGELRYQARLDQRGFVVGVGSPVGLASERVPASQLEPSFPPPEILSSAALPVEGKVSAGRGLRLTIRDVGALAPPALDFQDVQVDGTTWQVRVNDATVAPPAEVSERTHYVARTLGNDLGITAMSSEEALAIGRGDCTAHAVVLFKMLEDRGYQTRLVTGFVLDDGALRRHRWVTVRVGRAWVPLDPMFDEAPASPRHLALAVHGATLDELAFVDDVAFAGWEAAKARFSP